MESKLNDTSSLKQIADKLLEASSVLIFTHIQMDGDALGSSAALCHALRKMGKEAEILIEDKIPDNLMFLDDGYCVWSAGIKKPDICVALDCSDIGRLGRREEAFKEGKTTIFIDHHATAIPFGHLNYMDAGAAATGEIVFKLLKEMDYDLDSDAAEKIYTAIVTDTGRFMYSNTTGDTHCMVSELFRRGIDHEKVSVEIYQKKRIEKVKLMNAIMGTIELFNDGKACMALMTENMLKDTGAYAEESEGMVEELRNIEGIEIATLLKEHEEGIKVTMRSKSWADVSKIAVLFDGGGHKKAAGCTLKTSMEEAKLLIKSAINKILNTNESVNGS